MSNNLSPHGASVSIGTVSHGTLRTQDLLRAFADELERLFPFNGKALVSEARQNADILDMASATDRDADIAYAVVEDLIDELNRACPEGVYFGSSEGDGSDFGFWPLPD